METVKNTLIKIGMLSAKTYEFIIARKWAIYASGILTGLLIGVII
jgi:hypothetical protein